MPKRKPDQVIVHRIELQDSERDSLDMWVASRSFANIGEGVGAVLKPITGMTITGMAALIALGLWKIDKTSDDIENQLARDPDSVPTMDVVGAALWNATGPGIVADVVAGDSPAEYFGERVTYARTLTSRGWGWLKDLRDKQFTDTSGSL